MILTNWAYVLTALLHCSLPPYILPECMKWLLKPTSSNHGFRLNMTTLLVDAADALARDTTPQTNPSSTWDLATPPAFLAKARPHLTKIGEAPTDATRHALISHDAVIEQ